MIQEERVKVLNNKAFNKGEYVLYWMQRAQRANYNHALEFAIEKANTFKQPVVVYFGLTDSFPEANLRHYYFMLEGLQETKEELEKRGVKFILRREDPTEGIVELAKDSSLLLVDGGYLEVERKWRDEVASKVDIPCFEVETDIVVPVEVASNKEEYAAYTIRKKINSNLDRFLIPLKERKVAYSSLDLEIESLELEDVNGLINTLDIDRSVAKIAKFKGGNSEAKKWLKIFIDQKLEKYEDLSSHPDKDYQSNLGPYLHFGQISPLYVALKVKKSNKKGKEDFLEQLIVRRELSYNFVYYNDKYNKSLKGIIPDWAWKTLEDHKGDTREYIYTKIQLEEAKTHDPYWNAAQKELLLSGKIHGYMRMYWGKKILEWTSTPQEGFETALYLNNKYSLDGRDPNGFAGVAWCFGKHDRAWTERDIFGKVRYMNAKGLERKFDIDTYLKKIGDENR
ncbi:deoxyribodipyrimidine photo-lyase [Halonatronum saccharophilum]|uniref:deoxyribodipyrimidine photo-lyase n=1 Tax=Halonatronum saccharophilum TaxID=150060 RepID=UPI0004878D67|nr:deoxyribodipyrimidine photo-lyase [Halonatronum saccharophilum]